ncbi:restriction endonuclease subunit S, partial [Hydrogenivirga sp. 128-5-R1-1]|uniref:restriction endonuclease subunit S n=1 Tax=Hydrogenivirga sp. 128-5-R1-1 TaxID=392423 RepID=UPI00015F0D69
LIPEDWEVVRLGDIAEIQQGKTPKRDLYDDRKGYRIIKVKDFENEKFVKHYPNGERSFVKVDLGNRYTLEQGDILILSAGHSSKVVGQKIGFYNVNSNNKVFFVSELLRIRANNKTNPLFLFFSIISQKSRKQIKEEIKGGHLYPRDLVNLKIPLPPLPEQKAIATVLDKIRQAIEQTEEVIQANKELKKSLMKHFFTYGVVPPEETDKVKLKETEIGLIPEHWEIKTLKDSVDSIEYGYSVSIPANEDQKGIPIISTADITKEGKLLYNKIRKIKPPKRLTEKLILKDGDVLFNWRNSPELIGKTTVFEAEKVSKDDFYIYASFILRIRSKESESNNFYLKYLLNYYREIGTFIKLARRAVNQANYNRNEIYNLKIPLPPIDEQKQIAKILNKIDNKIEAEENKKEALEKLFKSLLNNLMTGKIRLNKNFIEKFEKEEIHQKMKELSKKLSEDKEYLEEIKEFEALSDEFIEEN